MKETTRKKIPYVEATEAVSGWPAKDELTAKTLDELNNYATSWLQAGVVSSEDWTFTATIVGATAALGSSATTGGNAWLPDPVVTSDLMPSTTAKAKIEGKIPAPLPSAGHYMSVAFELTPTSWGATATVSVKSGVEKATQAEAEAAPPATTVGKIQVRRVILFNNAGSYEIKKQEDARPYVRGGRVFAGYLDGTAAERPGAGIAGRIYYATDTKIYSVDTGAAWNELTPKVNGHANIATEQSRASVSFGTLATPDEVEVALPANGLLAISYQATWKGSANPSQITAAIFLGANQVQSVALSSQQETPAAQQAQVNLATAGTVWLALGTTSGGLVGGPTNVAGGASYTGDVTTGQILGGETLVFAAAGTYKVTVQFKASSGQVTAKNRKLWVEARTL